MTRVQRNVLALVLVIGFVIGLALVLLGGSDQDDASSATTTEPPPAMAEGSGEPLELEDLSVAGVAQLSGLAIPADADDYLTARLGEGAQLDVTFTLPAEDVEAFLRDSDLGDAVAGQRVILHSSPLWRLNPDSEIRGVSDRTERVNRGVELVNEDADTVRVRVVLTSA